MAEEQEKWIKCELDKEGLCTAVSEAAWCAETKSHNQDSLYTTYIEEGGITRREVREEWASQFFSLRSAYQMLIESYIKTEKDV